MFKIAYFLKNSVAIQRCCIRHRYRRQTQNRPLRVPSQEGCPKGGVVPRSHTTERSDTRKRSAAEHPNPFTYPLCSFLPVNQDSRFRVFRVFRS